MPNNAINSDVQKQSKVVLFTPVMAKVKVFEEALPIGE